MNLPRVLGLVCNDVDESLQDYYMPPPNSLDTG